MCPAPEPKHHVAQWIWWLLADCGGQNCTVLKQTHGAAACLGDVLRNGLCNWEEILRSQKEGLKVNQDVRILRLPLKQNLSVVSTFLSVSGFHSQLPLAPSTLRHNSVSEKKDNYMEERDLSCWLTSHRRGSHVPGSGWLSITFQKQQKWRRTRTLLSEVTNHYAALTDITTPSLALWLWLSGYPVLC